MDSSKINSLLNLFELLTRTELNGTEDYDPKKYKYKLISDLRGTKWFFEESQKKSQTILNENFGLEDLCLQFIIYLHLSLSLLVHENFSKKCSFPHIKLGSFSFQSIYSLRSTLTNLINSLLSVRLLLTNGFNIQANQLVRSYIEYADIAIACVSNKEFFEKYKSMTDSIKQEKEVWWKYVRHESITKVLKESLYNIYPDHKHWEVLFEIRKPIYKNSSDHLHGHSAVNLFGAYQTPFGEEENSRLTLGGFTSQEMKITYTNLIIYSHQFISNLSACFVHYHNLPFVKFGSLGKDYAISLKISEHFQKLIIKLNSEEYNYS